MAKRRWARSLGAVLVAALVGAGCSDRSGSGKTVVASIYPLAYAAERIAGPDWEVIDLTRPGADAHDIELSLKDRAAIEDADLVIYIDVPGFQPQIEEAIAQAGGRAVAVSHGPEAPVHPTTPETPVDPHVWLNPLSFQHVVPRIAEALTRIDPRDQGSIARRRRQFTQQLEALHREYARGLRHCIYRTIVVSHEAFGYAGGYGFRQYGLSGLAPEAEPTTRRLEEAQRLLEEAKAGAVFYEPTEEAERIAKTVAADAGVPALPLHTLESEPPRGNYITAMEANLQSLRRGLGCR